MRLLDRLKAAWEAFRKDEGPLNGGHRYAVQSTDNTYCWADAYRIDPISGDPQWYCVRDGYSELKTKLPGWGILVDLRPEMTLEEFKKL